MALSDQIRRVVTGHDPTGKAVVLFDGPSLNKIVREKTGVVNRLVWQTDVFPTDISGNYDRAVERGGIAWGEGGSSFRVVEFPSMSDEEIAAFPSDLVAKQFGSDAPTGYRPPSHPFMHRTRTLDYAIVLAGEIDMKLDDDELVHLRAGDILVQQGTNHAWINRTGSPCRIAFIFLDAKDPLA
jgi:hypothetical protein